MALIKSVRGYTPVIGEGTFLADNATIVITHYQRLLDYIKPDFVHILYKGRIVRTGGPELALELEERGYDWIKEDEQ